MHPFHHVKMSFPLCRIIRLKRCILHVINAGHYAMKRRIIRPHRSTTYVDAVYCYRPSSVVCRSVRHTSDPCKNGWTDRDAVWVWHGVLYYGYGLWWAKETQVQSYSPGSANVPSNVPSWEGTLAPPGEYDWTVHLQRRCGLMSNYFDHCFLLKCAM